MHDYSNLRPILLEVLVIVVLGMVIGLSVNLKLVHQVIKGQSPVQHASEIKGDSQTTTGYPQPVDLESLQLALDNKELRLIDARIAELYAEGHLPGAFSLPLDEIDHRLDAFQRQFSLKQKLAVYCNGYGCPDSFDLALKLIAAGFEDVLVYEGGFPEWRDAGLPIHQGTEP